MISSVLLRQYDKYLEECEEPLDLFPAGKKSVKSLASFATNHFRFEVETETATDSNLSIELNGGAELFVLSPVDGEEHRFVSEPIRSDGFLRFNLGLYRLSLR